MAIIRQIIMPVKEAGNGAKAIVNGEHSFERRNEEAINVTKANNVNAKASITFVRVKAKEGLGMISRVVRLIFVAKKANKAIL